MSAGGATYSTGPGQTHQVSYTDLFAVLPKADAAEWIRPQADGSPGFLVME